ncbi:MAG: NAD(P)-dependent alcohol dehydrogenase [Alphaproteobacteria bacterium]|nr:NAD(P)-dependent alcohol dehydrogenase [Alphaproteobacteria bacterium]
MIKTKAYAALDAGSPLQPFSFERRDPNPSDVVIKIDYCGICHTDIHQVRNEWKNSTYPMVPGHEIVGTVVKIGTKVTKYKVGDKVGVGCFVDSCRVCSSCQNHLEQYCLNGMSATYNSVERDGKTKTQGGYSDHIVVDENYVLRIPQNLSLDAAAPLLCAGITLYSPLMHWKASKGKKIAIIGLGGLGHMGVKLAHALEAEVTVLSHSTKKENDAKKLGADYFYSTQNPETFKKLQGYFDLIINTVSAVLDWNQYLSLVKIDGHMVVVGAPDAPVPIMAFSLVAGRKTLAGSMIGGIKETQEMLDFCGKHNIVSDIELIPIQQVNQAYERILKSDVRYRFVIDMASLK